MRISEKKFRRLIRRVITENTQMAMEYHDDDNIGRDADLDDEYMDYDSNDDLNREEPVSHKNSPGFILTDLTANDNHNDMAHSDNLDDELEDNYNLDRRSRRMPRRREF
tara:strand:- start:302 stop:628 length:327 start_codon:yes stop_codon:yes gene_type:complete